MIRLHSFEFQAMGTNCAIHLYAGLGIIVANIAAEIVEEVRRIESRYSRYCPNSWLSEINRFAANGRPLILDAESVALLDFAFACYRISGGLFDISSGILRQVWNLEFPGLPKEDELESRLRFVGMDKLIWNRPQLDFQLPGLELDFGGIGKEYAVDRAYAICAERGIKHVLIDLGGDLRVIGAPPDQAAWTIKIRHPQLPEQAIALVDIKDEALATSGNYERFIEVDGERYSHILNPFTGWPVRGISSVSVIASDCLLAGALATIACLKGRGAVPWLRTLNVAYCCVDENGTRDCYPESRWISTANDSLG